MQTSFELPSKLNFINTQIKYQNFHLCYATQQKKNFLLMLLIL